MKVYDNIPERLLVKNKNPKLYSRLIELGCEPKWAKKLDPNEIITDQGIYPREKTDLSQVDIYASDMENGDEFPTIIVTMTPEGHYLLVDGNHRLLAARKAGIPVNAELWDIPVHYIDYVATIANTIGRGKQGKDLSGAVKYKKIVEAYTSGKNRDIKQLAEDFETSISYVKKVLSKAGIIRSEKEEKRKKAEELYNQGYSIREIAEKLNKPKSTISDWLSENLPGKKSDTTPQPSQEEPSYEEETEEYDGSWDDWNEEAEKETEEEQVAEEPKAKHKKESSKEEKKLLHPNHILERDKNAIWDAVIEIEFHFGEEKALEVLEEIYFAYKERKHKGLTIYKDRRALFVYNQKRGN